MRDPARARRRSSEGVAESRRRVASGSPRFTAQRHCRARRLKAASRSRTTTPTAPDPSRCRRSSPRAAAKRTTPARPPRWAARAGFRGPILLLCAAFFITTGASRGGRARARGAMRHREGAGTVPSPVTEAGTAARSRSGSRPCSRSTPCTARRARGRTSRCARRRRRRRRRRAPPIYPPRPIPEVRTEAGANAAGLGSGRARGYVRGAAGVRFTRRYIRRWC